VGVEGCVWNVRVEVPVLPDDSETEAGFRDTVGPEGETVEERLTVPVKPPMLVREILDVADDPGATVIDEGLAEMRKSATMRLTEAECESEPLVPVTVIV